MDKGKSGLIGDSSLEAELYRLARKGWEGRRQPPDQSFLLRTNRLPALEGRSNLQDIVEAMYAHARRWVPGFEVPFYVPTVTITPFLDGAGQFRVDDDGYPRIQVDPGFVPHYPAVITILAHEACHHILGLSNIGGMTSAETERMTDLTAFVCGFGYLMLSGHSMALRVDSRWVQIHVGYLSTRQYSLAHEWVLRAQGLDIVYPDISDKVPKRAADRLSAWDRLRIRMGIGRRQTETTERPADAPAFSATRTAAAKTRDQSPASVAGAAHRRIMPDAADRPCPAVDLISRRRPSLAAAATT